MTPQEFIGNDLFHNYEDIYPIVRMVLYRCNPDGEAALFPYDGDWTKNTSIRHRILKSVRFVLYHIRRLFRRSAMEDTIFLSDTMLRIDRYRGLLDEIYTNYNVVASGAISNIINRPIPGMGFLSWKIFLSRKLFFGESVSGQEVKDAAKQLRDLFVELINENRRCCDEFERVDECLHTLQVAANQRITELSLLLKRERVKCFITINAYNLRDVVITMACRRVGIWTKELSHHTWCSISPNFKKTSLTHWFFTDVDKAFSFVNESCQWSSAEKQYCEKYNVFHALYNDLQISVSGCPEVTKIEFAKNTAKYQKENAIVIFVPTIALVGGGGTIPENDRERLEIMSENYNLFRKAAILAKKQNMKVYVRYHPSEQKFLSEQEKELLNTLGFQLLSSSREDFIKAVCTCKVAIGYMTSAFISALIYGCKCYNLVIDGKNQQFDYCGLNIHNIFLDQIVDISLDSPEKYIPVSYIDVDRLCLYPD